MCSIRIKYVGFSLNQRDIVNTSLFERLVRIKQKLLRRNTNGKEKWRTFTVCSRIIIDTRILKIVAQKVSRLENGLKIISRLLHSL